MEIQAAIQSLLTIKTIADGLIAMRDETKVLETKLALMQQVFEIRQVLDSLQEESATVKQENRELKEAARQVEQRLQEREGYELFEVAPGAFVYAAKTSDGSRQQAPYYCQACYDSATKSVLSFKRSALAGERPALQCPAKATHSISLSRGTTPEWLAKPD